MIPHDIYICPCRESYRDEPAIVQALHGGVVQRRPPLGVDSIHVSAQLDKAIDCQKSPFQRRIMERRVLEPLALACVDTASRRDQR